MGQNVSKIREEIFLNYIKSSYIISCDKMGSCSWRFWSYIKSLCGKMFQYYWCTLKALLLKNLFYFFFLIFWLAKFHHLLRCHGIDINSSQSPLCFLNLLCQAKSVTRIIASGSFSSQLLLRLMLLRFTRRIQFHYNKMWHHQNSHQNSVNHHLCTNHKVF